ncbi:hypothetical protein NA78x_003443 [Anatilimnocola sp. NA78]|uniref:hypothetical protein n=1 Tax=Anatilimnocola sp. NA78 TaxID=3415683 RepID=UPI003CE58419
MNILKYFLELQKARTRRLKKLQNRQMPKSTNSASTRTEIAELLDRVSHQSLKVEIGEGVK